MLTMTKSVDKYQELLEELPFIKSVKHIKSAESSVTTSWGAEPWTEDMISRDILQNFRDALVQAKKNVDQVKISTENDQISVYAPTEFSLAKLFFIGSQKSELDNQIGVNGEGFKKCVSDLARQGIYNPINISGDEALIISVGNEVPGTDLRPLVYHFFKINKVEGSYFILNTISKKLKKAFEYGMKNFFYENNPVIGEKLYEYNDITVYKSKTANGVGFYKGLKRVDIENIPVVININKSYAALERKVKMDRDRNAFDKKLQTTFFNIFTSSGFHYSFRKDNAAIHYILKSSKPIWKKGHLLLSSIAKNFYSTLKDDKAIQKMFGKEYYAESRWHYSGSLTWSDWYSTKTQSYILRRDRQEEKNKKIKLPSYFANFGVMSSLEAFLKNKDNAEKRLKNKSTSDLTPKEKKAINFCFEAAKSIAPNFANLFDRSDEDNSLYEVKFKKIKCKDLLGQLRNNGHTYNSKTVYLHQDLFKGNFGKMFSVFLHELSHAGGADDGTREFSDCLTWLLEQSISKNKLISKYSRDWDKKVRVH